MVPGEAALANPALSPYLYHDMCCSKRAKYQDISFGMKFYIPSLLVVNRWSADGGSGSHHAFRFRHDVWRILFHQGGEQITSIISIACGFTAKSGGIWYFLQ